MRLPRLTAATQAVAAVRAHVLGGTDTLRNAIKRRVGVPSIPAALDRLKAVGFAPRLIFDVGAYQGDFARECLARWPARVTCFDVLEGPLERLRTLAASEPLLRVRETLLGSQVRAAVAFHEARTASSVLREHVNDDFPVSARPMTTIDEVVRAEGGQVPDFLKLDVQGYELEVLTGAERSLPGMQVILAEVNLLDIHVGVPLLADVVGWLAQRGWLAYDVCALTRRPLDGALWQADMVFVPQHSPLRADKRWR